MPAIAQPCPARKGVVRQVAYARREAVAEQMSKVRRLDLTIRWCRGALFDSQFRLVMEQAIEHISRFPKVKASMKSPAPCEVGQASGAIS